MRTPKAPKGTRITCTKSWAPAAAGSGAFCVGSPSLSGASPSFLFSVSQLNRPKVNKIVEILEKAKSCYCPALQNVYTDVMEGELRKGHCPWRGPRRLPTRTFLWGRSWVLREQVSTSTEPPVPVSDRRGCERLLSFRAGLKEASDIVLYLKPLRVLLEEMEQADFTMVCQPERGHS